VSQKNDATGCESTRANVGVVIKSSSKPIISATGLGTGNIQLSSSASQGNQWFKDGTLIAGATSQTYSVLTNGGYQVQVTADGCVSELSEPFMAVVTGVEVQELVGLKIFPVPASQSVMIQLTGVNDDEISSLMIFDVLGRVVDNQSIRGKESTLAIENYPAGQYFLRVSNKSFLLTSRIIKN
jgi:hypothetical protein